MASAARITRFTPEQYLALERKAEFKSEYDNGFITAMAGASREHNLITGNFVREISSQLRTALAKSMAVTSGSLSAGPDSTLILM